MSNLSPYSSAALCAMTAIMLTAGAIFIALPTAQVPESEKVYIHDATVNPFWDAESFYPVIVEPDVTTVEADVRGIIIPHHLLASDLMAKTLAAVSRPAITRVVVIAPNHFELGSSTIITSQAAWSSPVGVSRPDADYQAALQANNELVAIDEEAYQQEHAVLAVTPFITHYFPEATVTPLLLSMKLTPAALDALVADLVALDTPDTLYIASVDFSHYQQISVAHERDAVTRALLEEWNYEAIMDLTSQYVDSPRSIVTLMKTMQTLGYDEISIRDNRNATDYITDYTGEITTYFTALFLAG